MNTKKKLTLYMEEVIIKNLKFKALEEDVSLSVLVERVMKEYLKQKPVEYIPDRETEVPKKPQATKENKEEIKPTPTFSTADDDEFIDF